MSGVDGVVARWFGGDRDAYLRWFAGYGFFVYVRSFRPWELLPGGKFYGAHPGPHPAWPVMGTCGVCQCPDRDCVCRLPAF